MLIFKDYDTIIFDCDGVILDSNELKIDAMREALNNSNSFERRSIENNISYFRKNFGNSRHHHVAKFTEPLQIGEQEKHKLKESIIKEYSELLESRYKNTKVTKGILELINSLQEKKIFIASGSEELQLKRVFQHKGLYDLFDGIYGSPESKANNIRKILAISEAKKAVLIGDAVADFEAARANNIEFFFYYPLSNSKKELTEICIKHDKRILKSFLGLENE